MAKKAPVLKAALFDIDGTLLDTTELLFQAFEHTLETHAFPKKSREEIGIHIGKPIYEIYQELAPGGTFESLFTTHTTFQLENIHLTSNYTHTISVLKKLKEKGVKIAAITNRFRTTHKSLELANIAIYMDFVLSGEDVQNLKPHPEGIKKTLSHFKLKNTQAVMIGDSPADIVAGKSAGVATIGVTYGFHGEKLAETKPDFLVSDIFDILPIILGDSAK